MQPLLRLWIDGQNRYLQIRDGEHGVTAVEQGIMIALLAAVIIIAARRLS